MPKGKKNLPKSNQPLTPKQKEFCKHYVRERNAAEAARLAGYTRRHAQIGKTNMYKPAILKEIARLQDKIDKENDIKFKDFIQELVALGFSNITNLVDQLPNGDLAIKNLEDIPKGLQKSIKKITIDTTTKTMEDGTEFVKQRSYVELHDKLQALKTLGQALGYIAKWKMQEGVVEAKEETNNFYLQVNQLAGILPKPDDDIEISE